MGNNRLVILTNARFPACNGRTPLPPKYTYNIIVRLVGPERPKIQVEVYAG